MWLVFAACAQWPLKEVRYEKLPSRCENSRTNCSLPALRLGLGNCEINMMFILPSGLPGAASLGFSPKARRQQAKTHRR